MDNEDHHSGVVLTYKSSDELDSVIIREAHLECLAPTAPLCSEILNFYIFYLQKTRALSDKLKFFTTYFYPKLCEMVHDKEHAYLLFRKWWKEDDLFKKSFIFVPVHHRDECHWSLVVIYNSTDLDSEILHLDSLNLPNSTLTLEIFARFLQREWMLLYPEIPRRIITKKLPVPQQQNGYDCGIFVLCFIECFLDDNPPTQFHQIFGKLWLSTERVSSLRNEIKHILDEKAKADIYKSTLHQGSSKGKDLSEATPGDEGMMVNLGKLGISSTKRRKQISKVWEHFTKVPDGAGKVLALCNYCKKELNGSSVSGTTHIWNHLNVCQSRGQFTKVKGDGGRELARCNYCNTVLTGPGKTLWNHSKHCTGQANVDADQQLPSKAGGPSLTNGLTDNSLFDQEISGLDFARMIIKHWCPLDMVDHGFLRVFLNNLQQKFEFHSQDNVRAAILKMYEEEKQKVYKIFDKLCCRISLAINIWTSNYKSSKYCSFTASFVDDGNGYKKRVLAFRKIETKDNLGTLCEVIERLLAEWNIEKVCAITMEHEMVGKFVAYLYDKEAYPLHDNLFFVACSSHTLNLMVRDVLGEICDVLHKIRKTIGFVNETNMNKQMFQHATSRVKLQFWKDISLDVASRWDSTFHMLKSALELQEAFSLLEQVAPNLKVNLSMEEWKMASVMCQCLEVFYDAIDSFAKCHKGTAYLYFSKICDIHMNLKKWEKSKHACVCSMTNRMKEKFYKYWTSSSIPLAIAVLLDPRHKHESVRQRYMQIYDGEEEPHIKEIIDSLDELYVVHGGCLRNQESSELSNYLKEPRVPLDIELDIFSWWCSNSSKFPILGMIARDVVTIPFSTISPEFAFSTEGADLNPAIHGLDPELVEAFMCLQD